MADMDRTIIMGHERMKLTIERFAHQILEHFDGEKELVLIGIKDRGLSIAEQIARHLARISDIDITQGEMSMDKSAALSQQADSSLTLESLVGKHVVLVDDVLNSGKTLVQALRLILSVDVLSCKTIVLVDRIHRRFPVRADFVGMTLSTTLQERVEVEMDGKEHYAYLV